MHLSEKSSYIHVNKGKKPTTTEREEEEEKQEWDNREQGERERTQVGFSSPSILKVTKGECPGLNY